MFGLLLCGDSIVPKNGANFFLFYSNKIFVQVFSSCGLLVEIIPPKLKEMKGLTFPSIDVKIIVFNAAVAKSGIRMGLKIPRHLTSYGFDSRQRHHVLLCILFGYRGEFVLYCHFLFSICSACKIHKNCFPCFFPYPPETLFMNCSMRSALALCICSVTCPYTSNVKDTVACPGLLCTVLISSPDRNAATA